ncbi:MAG TPA: glycosyltransferase [Lamprocystis sp. (in: g-proteobacteria)]|nr:glycosyltransferase [Lamprocystis sp. (in: g-proteobacteria)]
MTPVCHVVQHLRPGGIETLVLELARLAPPGQVTAILSLEGTPQAALSAWPRLRQSGADLGFFAKAPGWRVGCLLALWRHLRQVRPRAVHTHHVGPLIYGGLAARLAGVPQIIHTEHDAWHLQDARRRLLQGLILKLVRPVLVADSSAVAVVVRAELPGWPIQVIRNGVDTDRFTPGDRLSARAALAHTAAIPASAPLIGCAARLNPVKGHRFLLEALARLDPGVHLALAGGGEEEAALRAQSSALGCAARVHFLGPLDAMNDFYRALDLFCLPSLAEGMPLSPLEAQSCGVPVVVTDVGGAGETVCPASGRLVAPGDAPGLAAALAGQLGRTDKPDPRPFVLAHGNARAMVDAYTALYR